MPWSWVLCLGQGFGLVWRSCPLGVPHNWHAKTARERNQETEEGARGSSAVRQRNCQHLAKPSGPSERVSGTLACNKLGSAQSEAARNGGNPSGPEWTQTRRLQHRADCSNEQLPCAGRRLPCRVARMESTPRSPAQSLVESAKQYPLANSHKAGSSEPSMILSRSITPLTQADLKCSMCPLERRGSWMLRCPQRTKRS